MFELIINNFKILSLLKFKLTKKIQLTADIFELTYDCENELSMIPGQFITFILPWIWWRAYSILELKWNEVILVIKKWTIEMLWRWGSIMLCDANIWDEFNWVWPAGHFILKNENNNKLFLGTWTWFVPLFNQINHALKSWIKWNIKFVFWVRETKWVFYVDKLEYLKEKYSNFDFEIYVSREKSLHYHYWYNTDYINNDTIKEFDEYYICWAPWMIESAILQLDKHWVDKNKVYYEKY